MKSAPATFGTQLLRNSITLYAMAHITLSIDVQDLQVFAGELIHSGTQIVSQAFEVVERILTDATNRHHMNWRPRGGALLAGVVLLAKKQPGIPRTSCDLACCIDSLSRMALSDSPTKTGASTLPLSACMLTAPPLV